MVTINKSFKKWVSFTFLALIATACSLDIEETDSIITEESAGTFDGIADTESAVTELFNSVRGQLEAQDNYFALAEVSTDELLVPTRGTDWGDNGIWRTLHAHTWTPAHAYVLTVWNQFNQNIFRASEIIDPRSSPTAGEVAQAKFIRAYSMWVIMDTYGVVPFREPDQGAEIDPIVMTRTEAFDFIEDDLTTALPDLPATGPNDRATQASANFLLARLYLNAHVYKGLAAPDNSDLQAVVTAVDAIEDDGYALQAGYFDLFTDAADTETIWYVTASVGNRIWNGLHYHQISSDNTGGGWNGFTTLAEFYDTFEGPSDDNSAGAGQEERRGWVPDETNADASNLGIGYGFLIGQQYGASGFTDGVPNSVGPLNDRAGNPLVFTKELAGLIGNNERHGVRVIKYHPVNGAFAGHQIIFRYADAHLMRAEAMMRMNSGDALAEVNELRALRGANNLSALTEADMLEERGRELYIEFTRRTDMIRFGQFTRDWPYKDDASVNDANRLLYPIPSNALLSNPNLVQNPGY